MPRRPTTSIFNGRTELSARCRVVVVPFKSSEGCGVKKKRGYSTWSDSETGTTACIFCTSISLCSLVAAGHGGEGSGVTRE